MRVVHEGPPPVGNGASRFDLNAAINGARVPITAEFTGILSLAFGEHSVMIAMALQTGLGPPRGAGASRPGRRRGTSPWAWSPGARGPWADLPQQPYVLLLAGGLASGLLAGLLGIGGALVTIPVLYAALPALGIDPDDPAGPRRRSCPRHKVAALRGPDSRPLNSC